MANDIGKWAVIIGALIALVGAFVAIPYLGLILLVLGFVAGYVAVVDKEAQSYIVVGLGLALGVGTLVYFSDLSTQLAVIETIGKNLVTLISAGVLAVALKAVAKQTGLLK